MIENRIHGRGGQGAVLAALVLARAAFRKGFYVQSFPEFGVERRGAPVTAFLRISEQPIYLRTKIYSPDNTLFLDPSLLDLEDGAEGLKPGGLLCVNRPEKYRLPSFVSGSLREKNWRLATVDGSAIAARLGLGSQTAPIVNTVMVGAFAKATQWIDLESLTEAILETFPDGSEKNVQAARQGFEQCQPVMMSEPGFFISPPLSPSPSRGEGGGGGEQIRQ